MKKYDSFKMKKYEILKQIGEGSFGQVYKAKKRSNGEIVAFKMIRKCGRSLKELKSLRQECEIQRHLHHPNIVQMIDSFETENEIVVVTEYANKELYEILNKEGKLSEERAQVIACDLVSALYYLHSNRVMHRDLKPQNVLLEANGVAKLCDFGFARSMSTGTHVLTSIKGTPLYMAPELIEEYPYDHNADLWSLGCIIYELVVGSPPFQTNSILHLIKLIRFEAIKWPDFISANCKNFLQGLLQKDPSRRLTWPTLLEHPFIKDRIIIVEGTVPTPFTTPLSASQARAKQQQLQAVHSANKAKIMEEAMQEQEKKHQELYYRMCNSQPGYPSTSAYCQNWRMNNQQASCRSEPSGTDSSASIDVLLGNLSIRASLQSDLLTAECTNATYQSDCPRTGMSTQYKNYPVSGNYSKIQTEGANSQKVKVKSRGKSNRRVRHASAPSDAVSADQHVTTSVSCADQVSHDDGDSGQSRLSTDYEFDERNSAKKQHETKLSDWDLRMVEKPIENEEWIVFLQKSMKEIMEGVIDSVLQENCLSVFMSPLRNPAASCRVVEFVACLLILPFCVPAVSKENRSKIQRVYLDVRVVPNVVYAVKLLMSKHVKSESGTPDDGMNNAEMRRASSFSVNELRTIEHAMLLLNGLGSSNNQFLTQFCDAIYIVNGTSLLREMLNFEGRNDRIIMDLIGIFLSILRSQPENAELVERVILRTKTPEFTVELLNRLLNHQLHRLRSRTCHMIRLLGRFCCRALQQIWNKSLKNLIENLTKDESELVREAANDAVAELRKLTYYNQKNSAN